MSTRLKSEARLGWVFCFFGGGIEIDEVTELWSDSPLTKDGTKQLPFYQAQSTLKANV